MDSKYLKLLTERDMLISHLTRIDAALTRIRYGTCYECSNIDREVDNIYSVLNEMLREKNYEIDKLFIANDAKS